MLSYEDALGHILAGASLPLPPETIPLSAAAGRVLATSLIAHDDLPSFANSAVDGFAVHVRDTANASVATPVVLPITQTIPAGSPPEHPLAPGEAARILTGAPLPEGADGIVMVEDTRVETRNRVAILLPATPKHIRLAGSDLARGEQALTAGATLDAGTIGLLAALNQAVVECHCMPRVAILTTGDEVIPLGDDPLQPGQIRNSNGPMLAAAVAEAGGQVVEHRHARDDEAGIRGALASFAGADVIIASGGVSVGDFDFVKKVVQEVGTLDFWRVAIKPGKPLAFGRVHDAVFFGLPGNPVSSLVTFELFVRPLLRRLAGHTALLRPNVTVRLADSLAHKPGRREFARARVFAERGQLWAELTGGQGSHRLTSLAGANALLIAHEERADYARGEEIPALLTGSVLPGN